MNLNNVNEKVFLILWVLLCLLIVTSGQISFDLFSHCNEWPRYLQGNNLMCHPVLNCSGEDRLLPGGVNDLPAAAQEKCFFR